MLELVQFGFEVLDRGTGAATLIALLASAEGGDGFCIAVVCVDISHTVGAFCGHSKEELGAKIPVLEVFFRVAYASSHNVNRL